MAKAEFIFSRVNLSPPTEKGELNARVSYNNKRNKTAQINSSSTTGAKVLPQKLKELKGPSPKKVRQLFGHGEMRSFKIFS